MYTIQATIRGTAAILQHKFSDATLLGLQKRESKRKSGKPDYSDEWLGTMYAHNGYVYQPANHIEGALVKAATRFRSGKQTWKDPFRAYVYIVGIDHPDKIYHYFNGQCIPEPTIELIENPTDVLSVNISRVTVQRAAVARSRLQIEPGWELTFRIEVHDEQVPFELVRDVLEEAGRAVGIGDYRPRYGRFEIIDFQKI